ncbi:MAG: hypothetical protein ACK5H0_10455 [Bacteroidota bacterium]|jgi:hypothetical protein
MDTHTESVSEAPAVETAMEQIPDAAEANSFEAALDAAFKSLESGVTEPTESPEPEAKEENSEPEAPVAKEADAEDDPLEQLTEDVDWTPKAANRFKQLKEELKGSRSELEQLRQLSKEQESKLQEMSALVENKDVEQLQAKLAEYEQERMFTNLEQTTAYQEAVTKPLVALMEQADQIAEKYDVDPNMLIDALALDDPNAQDEKLSELLPNASDRDKARIYRIIEEINPVLERRRTLFENVEEAAKEAALLEETRQKQELAERVKLRENVTRNVMDRITEKLPFVKTLEGLDIQAIQNKAASVDPSVIHPVDFAYNAVSAQLLPTIVREYVGLRKEIEALTDKLAEYETAEPTLSSGSPAKAQRSSSGGEGGFVDAINRAFGSA